MLYEQFFMLHQKLAVNAPANTATEVTLEQIAETLYCTTRNAKLVIRKLEEKSWIIWKAGRGRGNRSKLTFLADQADLLQEAAQQLALKGNIGRPSNCCVLMVKVFTLTIPTWNG